MSEQVRRDDKEYKQLRKIIPFSEYDAFGEYEKRC